MKEYVMQVKINLGYVKEKTIDGVKVSAFSWETDGFFSSIDIAKEKLLEQLMDPESSIFEQLKKLEEELVKSNLIVIKGGKE